MTIPEQSYQVRWRKDPEEGGFAAYDPERPGCITCGETLEEAITNLEDARRAWLEAAQET